MPVLTDRDFVALEAAQIAELPDQQLADAYTRVVLLFHRARLEGHRYARNRDPALPQPEPIAQLRQRLEADLLRRHKVWQIGITGESWLDDSV